MAIYFDETFEGTGYDEGAPDATAFGSGNSIDPDYSLPGSPPTEAGSVGARLVVGNSSNAYQYWAVSPQNVNYLGATVYLDANEIANSDYRPLFGLFTGAGAIICSAIYGKDGSGNTLLGMEYDENGSDGFTNTTQVNLDQYYQIEIYYNKTTGDWAWRLDGVEQDSGTTTSSRTDAILLQGQAQGSPGGNTIILYGDLWWQSDGYRYGSTVEGTIGQSSETAAAGSITAQTNVGGTLGQAAETASAFSISPQVDVSAALGQATETVIAQSITPQTNVGGALGQAGETDVAGSIGALPASGDFAKLFGVKYSDLPSESFAHGLTELSGMVIGDAYIMDLLTAPDAHSVSGNDQGVLTVGGTLLREQTIGWQYYDASTGTIGASGTVTVQPPVQQVTLGQATETVIAQSISPTANVESTLGQASETDVSQSITPQTNVSTTLGQAAETFAAQTIAGHTDVSAELGQAVETASALSITANTDVSATLAQAAEISTALSLSPTASVHGDIGQASEIAAALSITWQTNISSTLAQAAEISTAQAITGHTDVSAELGQAVETANAQTIAPTMGISGSIGQAPETVSALGIDPITPVSAELGQASETSIAQIIADGSIVVGTLGQAVELSSVNLITALLATTGLPSNVFSVRATRQILYVRSAEY
jgi:hypothetical protein